MFDRKLGKSLPTRRVRRALWKSQGGGLGAWREKHRVAGSYKPYKALQAYMPLVQEAMKLPETQRPKLPPLRHRGHGGRHPAWQRSCLGRAMANRSVY